MLFQEKLIYKLTRLAMILPYCFSKQRNRYRIRMACITVDKMSVDPTTQKRKSENDSDSEFLPLAKKV